MFLQSVKFFLREKGLWDSHRHLLSLTPLTLTLGSYLGIMMPSFLVSLCISEASLQLLPPIAARVLF
jgi:hypothetical protein